MAIRILVKLLEDRRGATAVEYALVAMLISVAAIGAFINLGDTVEQRFDAIETSLAAAL